METKLTWDEGKRRSNIAKHGLDFANAHLVLDSPYRLDVSVIRNGEKRIQSFSYVCGNLAVLLAVHVDNKEGAHIISFRRASKIETEFYHEWLENDFEDA